MSAGIKLTTYYKKYLVMSLRHVIEIVKIYYIHRLIHHSICDDRFD